MGKTQRVKTLGQKRKQRGVNSPALKDKNPKKMKTRQTASAEDSSPPLRSPKRPVNKDKRKVLIQEESRLLSMN